MLVFGRVPHFFVSFKMASSFNMLSSAKVLVELLSLGSGNSELFKKILLEGGWF